MVITKRNPSDYIASLPDEYRQDIATLDREISKAIPTADRVMWEGKFWGGSEQKIIGYGTYKYVGSNKKEGEWFKVGLAQQKNYITVFVSAVDIKGYLVENHKAEFGKAKIGKSTVSFKKLADINLPKLIEVVKRGYVLMKQ
jgi:hypothetical protein